MASNSTVAHIVTIRIFDAKRTSLLESVENDLYFLSLMFYKLTTQKNKVLTFEY